MLYPTQHNPEQSHPNYQQDIEEQECRILLPQNPFLVEHGACCVYDKQFENRIQCNDYDDIKEQECTNANRVLKECAKTRISIWHEETHELREEQHAQHETKIVDEELQYRDEVVFEDV